MLYKAEIKHQSVIKEEFVFNRLSHPNQVVRNVVHKMKGKINYYIVDVANQDGEIWRYSVHMKNDRKYHVRKLFKADYCLNKDQIDMIFTGNQNIFIG